MLYNYYEIMRFSEIAEVFRRNLTEAFLQSSISLFFITINSLFMMDYQHRGCLVGDRTANAEAVRRQYSSRHEHLCE